MINNTSLPKRISCWHLEGLASKQRQSESKQSLSKTGKLLPWAGEDHPAALSDCEDEDAFFWEP